MSKAEFGSNTTLDRESRRNKIEELSGESIDKIDEVALFLQSRDGYHASYEVTTVVAALALSDEHGLFPDEDFAGLFGISEFRLSDAIRQYRRVMR